MINVVGHPVAPASGCLVTGTDTGVGKTVVAAALCAALRARGEHVAAYKPVLTGMDEPADGPRDHELLGACAGEDPELVAPLRYGPPVSPHYAAQLDGVAIEPEALVAGVHEAAGRADRLVVEGVGGLLVPLCDRPPYTVLDLAIAIGYPLVIVARPGLGTINHTLLTIRVAREAGLDVRSVAITPFSAAKAAPDALERSNVVTIATMGRVEVTTIPHVALEPEALAGAGAAIAHHVFGEPGG